MSIHVDIGWLLATVLLSVRIAAATMVAPVLGPAQIPGTVRVLLVLVLSAALVTGISVPATTLPGSSWELVGAVLRELFVGSCFSLGFLSAYGATQFAGRSLDIQVGFGVASTLNPSSPGSSPLLGTVIGLASVMVFFGLDGHHVLIRTLTLLPLGFTSYSPDWAALIAQSGVMFTFGAALAAPVMLMLLLADLSMAVLARSMPLLNVFILSFAVKILAGLIGLAAAIELAGPEMAALYGTTFRYWQSAATTP
jgi:flagellar biosynthetic protein FliR